MPQYLKSKNTFIISYITGPEHIALGLDICHGEIKDFVINKKPASGACKHPRLDELKIKESVKRGLAKANEEFATDYAISAVDYIENDSPNYTLYEHCAYLIVKAIEGKTDFMEIEKW